VGVGLNQTVADVERTLIEAALRHSQGNQAKAAQLLKIPRTTLRDKMTKYGLVGDAATA
jgi:DNA-binding protein Fis